MAEWRPYAATHRPGTCWWCGRKLRRKGHKEWVGYGQGDNGSPWRDLGPAAKSGDYEDDRFCGLRCGYQYGVRAAT